MRIFLSYASEDREVAEEIYQTLIAPRRSVFFDKEDLVAGSEYHRKLRLAVTKSDIFVFLLSPDSIAKGRYTLTELRYAQDKWPDPHRHVLPVVVREPRGKVPPYLNKVKPCRPEGDTAADVLKAVDELRPPRRPTVSRPASRGPITQYIDYLDKEMAAMGQLSLVALLLAGIMIWLRVSPYAAHRVLCAAGLTSAVSASFLFYLQRPHLLWLSGQIAVVSTRGSSSSFTLEDWLAESEGWGMWVRHRAGWLALLLGSAYCVAAVSTVQVGIVLSATMLCAPLAVAAAAGVIQWHVHTRFSDEERPFLSWIEHLWSRVGALANFGSIRRRN